MRFDRICPTVDLFLSFSASCWDLTLCICLTVFEGAGAEPGAEQQQLPEAVGYGEEEDHQCPGGDQEPAGGAGQTGQQTKGALTQKHTPVTTETNCLPL